MFVPKIDQHGVWVTHTKFKGSYGRLAYEDYGRWWVNWESDGGKQKHYASLCDPIDLNVLPVEPESWFPQCRNCGEYAMPVGTPYMPISENPSVVS